MRARAAKERGERRGCVQKGAPPDSKSAGRREGAGGLLVVLDWWSRRRSSLWTAAGKGRAALGEGAHASAGRSAHGLASPAITQRLLSSSFAALASCLYAMPCLEEGHSDMRAACTVAARLSDCGLQAIEIDIPTLERTPAWTQGALSAGFRRSPHRSMARVAAPVTLPPGPLIVHVSRRGSSRAARSAGGCRGGSGRLLRHR